ncbi:pyrroline-5-carboxylate reductase [Heliobacterium gestii]|uniref:Pyrroline-5-carboxylate reductase n=1 Tax=Heliomicrobium gestii TaxID=2699 RepID=A0A845LB50_HELGE|nr:pyrroline-5-carboxylate reductase [Heliomicrobium gestii]MBM7867560.1 pyrroline-5-carboxylate reductase [Heliomicrobium gestii]MZP43892.1 pyrroline-5-carboxylate reductase [Heliomicrobium gestii]
MKGSQLEGRRIGFIGGGAMAEALLRGLVAHVPADSLTVSDVSPARREMLHEQLGVTVTGDNVDVCRRSDILVLAVKPQVLPAVLAPLKDVIEPSQLVISIAAGITLAQLEDWLSPEIPIVRVMPNTPALVGMGASALSGGRGAADADVEAARQLLEAVGVAEVLPEPYLDAVTGLSGSGPAYVYLFIEALIDAGVKEGLPRDLARRLALQTVTGSAEMIRRTGNHPAIERDKVTSPGGTTIAGVQALEDGGLRSAVYAAVHEGTRRARELSGSR